MQAVWLSIQRNHPFAYERLFLWRLMHRGCHHSSDVPPLASSDTGKTYNFSTADKLNTLLLNCLLSIRQLNNICKKANILQLKFAIRACFSYNLFCNVKLNTHRLKLFISNILFQFWVQVYTFLWNRKNCGIPIFLISQLDSLIV